jgi:hypothetical protein
MTGMDLWTDLRCPQCGKTARVRNMVQKSARMHRCPKLRGLVAPMVREGVKAEVVLHEREDYVGTTSVQLDPERKRPIMNMETKYADGHTDLTVYAPTATAKSRRPVR